MAKTVSGLKIGFASTGDGPGGGTPKIAINFGGGEGPAGPVVKRIS